MIKHIIISLIIYKKLMNIKNYNKNKMKILSKGYYPW